MKATFIRTVAVQQYTAYAILDVTEDRPDIQDFLQKLLNYELNLEDGIQKRICQYLREINLIDKDNKPTGFGDAVLKSGKLRQREKGKYRFWVVENELQPINFFLFSNEGYVFPRTHLSCDCQFYALKLNSGQLHEMQSYAQQLQQNSLWQFHQRKSRVDISNVIRFLDRLEQDVEIKRDTSRKLDPIFIEDLISLEELRKNEPKEFPDDGISCKIKFAWTVHPPLFTRRRCQ